LPVLAGPHNDTIQAGHRNPDQERTLSEQEDDFATLFEASIKATRFETGQTIEGTVVAIGPDVAFINVGGKG
jgi:hypothetical protein